MTSAKIQPKPQRISFKSAGALSPQAKRHLEEARREAETIHAASMITDDTERRVARGRQPTTTGAHRLQKRAGRRGVGTTKAALTTNQVFLGPGALPLSMWLQIPTLFGIPL
jgi:hypothetical protein